LESRSLINENNAVSQSGVWASEDRGQETKEAAEKGAEAVKSSALSRALLSAYCESVAGAVSRGQSLR
jgi:hypothetical protein